MTARLLLVLSVVAVAVATLTPATPGGVSLSFLCFRCGTHPGIDVVLNILLFLPFGAALGLLRVRARWVVVIVVAATTSIELLQFTVIPGRYASLRDIVSNSIGGVIGLQLAVHSRGLLAPSPRGALRLSACTAGLWLLSQAFTSWALAVVLPPTPWWAQIKLHDLGFPAVFDGSVVGVSIGDTAIPYSDQLGDSELAREAIRRGHPLHAVVTDVKPSRGTAPIVVLAANDNLSEIVSLLQKGTDVAFRVRTRASRVGLRSPALRLSNVFPAGSERDTVSLEGSYSAHRYTLRAIRSGKTLSRTIAPSASWTWILLIPLSHYAFGKEVRWVTAVWLAVALGLIGFWLAQARLPALSGNDGLIRTAILISLLAVGLGVVPLAFGLPASHWSEWFTAGAGAALGWAAARMAVRPPNDTELPAVDAE